MDYWQGVPLYQDRPKYGLVLKIILVLPVVLIAAGIYYWSTGEATGGIAFLAQAMVIGLAFWFVFPREYRVYEDHLRIVLGGPFSVKVGFQNVKAVRITSRSSLSVNFITRITRTYVEIAKKKGISIVITPTVAESFVEEANRALVRWAATRSQ
jgi:hypothetical protein